jgi:tRNA A37 threonylcarbamoyladenosine synthetase subunit TsaC/SUA5/YrdC
MNLVKSKLTRYSTIIYPIIDGIVNHKILGMDHTLGVRIPQNNFCNQLAKFSVNPITTTSVNRHGNTALNEPAKILEEFGKEIDLFVNGGNLEGNKGSSIYKLEHDKLVQLRG